MSALYPSEQTEDTGSGTRTARARTSMAVALSLLIGAVAGIVAYRYAATGGKPPAPAISPASTAPGAAAAVSNKPAVLRVDPQLSDGKMQVTVTLDQPVPYDAHRLDHPDRVYVDMHGARLAPELSGKTLFVNQGGVSDIRMAQAQPDTVRLVLDLEKRFDYSIAQETNPAALVVKLTPHAAAHGKRQPANSQPKKASE